MRAMDTMIAKGTKKKLSLADKRFGYVLGCEGYVTKEAAAEHLSVSERTVDRLVDQGRLRKQKRGPHRQSAVRICARSLREYSSAGEA